MIKKPLFLKNKAENKDNESLQGDDQATSSGAPHNEKSKGVRATMISLNQKLHFKTRPVESFYDLCQLETAYFCCTCANSICADCRLTPEGSRAICSCILPPDSWRNPATLLV